MSWDPGVTREIESMFADLSWRPFDIERALHERQAYQRAQAREAAALSRPAFVLSRARREEHRKYMREYMREYAKRRRREDPDYVVQRRESGRAANRRWEARKRGEAVPYLSRGGSQGSRPHRPHQCSFCHRVGHNRRRCPDLAHAT